MCVMLAARSERERELRERRRRVYYSTRGATVMWVLFTAVIVAAGPAREAGGLAHSRARGKGFSF